MRSTRGSKLEGIIAAFILCLSLLASTACQMPCGAQLTARYSPTAPTIDGKVDEVSEWNEAECTSITLDNGAPPFNPGEWDVTGRLCVMHDSINLYGGLWLMTTTQDVSFSFQADPGPPSPTDHDDGIWFSGGQFRDMHYSYNRNECERPPCWWYDKLQHGKGATQVDSIDHKTTLEFSHPLCSGDPDDFCLSPPNTIYFQLLVPGTEVTVGWFYPPSPHHPFSINTASLSLLAGPALCKGQGGDFDGDGVCGNVDNCLTVSNPGQENADSDGMGDSCDSCPHDPDNDVDGDGICGDVDNCREIENPNQNDMDGDRLGDVCDPYAVDENNTESEKPGVTAVFTASPGPEGTLYLGITVDLKAIDLDGDEALDDTYYIAPNEHNVIVRLFDCTTNLEVHPNRVLCSDSCSLPDNLIKVTAVEGAKRYPIRFNLGNWFTNLTAGCYKAEVSYVNFCNDPDLDATGVCLADESRTAPELSNCYQGIWQGVSTTPTNLIQKVYVGDQCPDLAGDMGGTGCPYADKNIVTLHTLSLGKKPSTRMALGGASIHVFDRNNFFFSRKYTNNPKGPDYGIIFEDITLLEAGKGFVAGCVTDVKGACYVGEAQPGSYLVIVKYHDSETGKTVYTGRFKDRSDFVNGIAVREFPIVKVYKKGIFQEFRGGDETVVTSSAP